MAKSETNLSNIDLNNLGNLIRTKRKGLKLTQQEVANSISLSSQHYSRIEKGEYTPSLQTFFKLAKVLDLNISDLNKGSSKQLSATTYEIVTLLDNFNPAQQKSLLLMLRTMMTHA